MIKVYGVPQSRSTRVLWALEELELSYEFHKVDFRSGEHRSDALLAINPAGKVPAMQIDDHVLLESGAILTFLADRFSHGQLIPKAGSPERAKHDQWSFFAQSELEQGLWSIGKHKFAIPEQYRVEAMLETAQWEFQKALQLLSQGLADSTFILGESFSVADIMLGQTLLWAEAFKQPLPQQNIQEYLTRLRSRPALALANKKEQQS